ncbi:MAG: methyltransferase domain-containing protein [Ferruginibacter sp.]
MSHHYSHLQSSIAILQSYQPGEPFVHFIKKYFSNHKKFGSKDRKKISALCYYYFRTHCLLGSIPMDEAIIKAYFLCESNPSAFLEDRAPSLNEKVSLSAKEKLSYLGLNELQLFPYKENLTDSIDAAAFAISFLQQPLLFIRTRPGKHAKVMAALAQQEIIFQLLSPNTLALENRKALPESLTVNKDFVVQDASSQMVFNATNEKGWLTTTNKPLKVWDCCAASGGKSLLIYDLLHKNIQLTVSDIRKNILQNLQQRLQYAGITLYKTFVADLEKGATQEVEAEFDLVICDAPCTGSGSWCRTPEHLAFFEKCSIELYAKKQAKIAYNASAGVKPGGLFFYITCSIFENENEAVVKQLSTDTGMQVLQMQYIKGYEHNADSMFVAVLKK